MKIILRTGAGRGEYELTGSQDGYTTASLFDKQIILEPSPGIRISTQNFIREVNGKRRIRLNNPGTDSHAYLTIAAALMMPKPIRQVSETGDGHIQMIDDHFALQDIQFDIVAVLPDEIIVRPTFLKIINTTDTAVVDVAERQKLIFDLWNNAETSGDNDVNSILIRAHHKAYLSGNVAELKQVGKGLRKVTTGDADPLVYQLHKFNLSNEGTSGAAVRHGIESDLLDANPLSIWESAQANIRKWRHIADRGAGGNKFRVDIKKVYNSTCLFSGYHLPNSSQTGSSGVDAAHILPWASHNLNTLTNGICLNKLCHWAFDAGLLRLDFDASTNNYLVSVPEYIKQNAPHLTLHPFLGLEGVIPRERLPDNPAFWPNPDFINKLNETVPS